MVTMLSTLYPSMRQAINNILSTKFDLKQLLFLTIILTYYASLTSSFLPTSSSHTKYGTPIAVTQHINGQIKRKKKLAFSSLYSSPEEGEAWFRRDSASTTPQLLNAIWAQIVEGQSLLYNGDSLTILCPEMESQMTSTFVDRLQLHLDKCMEFCDDFGKTLILSPHSEYDSYGRNKVIGFTVKSSRDRNQGATSLNHQDQEQNVTNGDDERIINVMKQWVNNLISGMKICPYTNGADLAGFPMGRVHYIVTRCTSMEEMYTHYWNEVVRMELTNEQDISCTVLIAPEFCYDNIQLFERFSNSLSELTTSPINEAMESLVIEFHPDWTSRDFELGKGSPANYARRSPWPMLNMLRRNQVQAAQENKQPGTDTMDNVGILSEIGESNLQNMLKSKDWSMIADFNSDSEYVETLDDDGDNKIGNFQVGNLNEPLQESMGKPAGQMIRVGSSSANEIEMLNTLRNDYEAKISEMEATYRETLDRAIQENQAVCERLSVIEVGHVEEIKAIQAQHTESLESVKKEYAATFQEAVASYTNEIEQQKRAYLDIQKSLKVGYRDEEKDTYMRESESVMENMRSQMKKDSDLAMEKMRSEIVSSYEAEMDKCKQDASNEILRINEEMRRSADMKLQQELDKVSKQHSEEIAMLQSASLAENEALKREINNMMISQSSANNQGLDVERIRAELDAETQKAMSHISREYETQLKSMTFELTRMTEEIENERSRSDSLRHALEQESNKSSDLKNAVKSYSDQVEQLKRAYLDIETKLQTSNGQDKAKEEYMREAQRDLENLKSQMIYEKNAAVEKMRSELISSHAADIARCKQDSSNELSRIQEEIRRSADTRLHSELDNIYKQHNEELTKLRATANREKDALKQEFDAMYNQRIQSRTNGYDSDVKEIEASMNAKAEKEMYEVRREYESKIDVIRLELSAMKQQFDSEYSRAMSLDRTLAYYTEKSNGLEEAVRKYSDELQEMKRSYFDIQKSLEETTNLSEREKERYMKEAENEIERLKSDMKYESDSVAKQTKYEIESYYNAEIERSQREKSEEIDKIVEEMRRLAAANIEAELNNAGKQHRAEINKIQKAATMEKEIAQKKLIDRYEKHLRSITYEHQTELGKVQAQLNIKAKQDAHSMSDRHTSELGSLTQELIAAKRGFDEARRTINILERDLQQEKNNVQHLSNNLDAMSAAMEENKINASRKIREVMSKQEASIEESLRVYEQRHEQELRSLNSIIESSQNELEIMKHDYHIQVENMNNTKRSAIDLARNVTDAASFKVENAERERSILIAEYENEVAKLQQEKESLLAYLPLIESDISWTEFIERMEQSHVNDIEEATTSYEKVIIHLESKLENAEQSMQEERESLYKKIADLEDQISLTTAHETIASGGPYAPTLSEEDKSRLINKYEKEISRLKNGMTNPSLSATGYLNSLGTHSGGSFKELEKQQLNEVERLKQQHSDDIMNGFYQEKNGKP